MECWCLGENKGLTFLFGLRSISFCTELVCFGLLHATAWLPEVSQCKGMADLGHASALQYIRQICNCMHQSATKYLHAEADAM